MTGYEYYNGGVGGETSTQVRTRFEAAPASRTQSTAVFIWAGRNNYSDPITIKADIAAMVARIGHTNYLVFSILNGDFGTTGTGEYKGGSAYNIIIGLNNDLAAIYGARYFDIRALLVASYNPNIAQDVIDFGNDIPPSSLRIDTIHLTQAGYQICANVIVPKLGLA